MRKCATWFAGTVVAASLQLATFASSAQAYPDRAIQMVVPYAAGGSTDLAGRIVAKALGERLHQAVVVENKVGAAGSVGVGQVARSAPDGYSLAVSGVAPTVLHQLLGRKLPYDPQKDLNPVAYLGSSGMVIITRKDSPFKNLRQVIEQAKAKPGTVSYGSAGHASPAHLATEYLSSMAGIRMNHIPYAGDSALMGDLMSGRIDIATVGIASVFSHMTAGSVTALALTSRERLKSFPALPTVAEAGFAGYEADIWNLLVLPKNTPQEVDAKLNATVNKLIGEKAVQDGLLGLGFTARPMSIPEINEFIRAEREKWTKVIRDSKITVD